MTPPKQKIPEGNYSAPRRELLGALAGVATLFGTSAVATVALLKASDSGNEIKIKVALASRELERSLQNSELPSVAQVLNKIRDDGLLDLVIYDLREKHLIPKPASDDRVPQSWAVEKRVKDFRSCLAMYNTKGAITVLSDSHAEKTIDGLIDRISPTLGKIAAR